MQTFIKTPARLKTPNLSYLSFQSIICHFCSSCSHFCPRSSFTHACHLDKVIRVVHNSFIFVCCRRAKRYNTCPFFDSSFCVWVLILPDDIMDRFKICSGKFTEFLHLSNPIDPDLAHLERISMNITLTGCAGSTFFRKSCLTTRKTQNLLTNAATASRSPRL